MDDNIKKLRLSLLVLIVLSVAIGGQLLKLHYATFPVINGTVIPEGRALAPFSLQDQYGEIFSNKNLLGQWSLVSYGYTNCPDICPTTLHVLTAFKKHLEKESRFVDLQVLFYSIDPQRDNSILLNEYMPYFHRDFLGLTAGEHYREGALAFEKSLGMKVLLSPLPEDEINEFSGDYSVSHGVMLYLLNPEGKLQAVFNPQRNEMGVQTFFEKTIYQDYISIRNYFS